MRSSIRPSTTDYAEDAAWYKPTKHGLSVSMLGDWLQCRQLARFRIAGVKSRKPSMALIYGTIVHSALQEAHEYMVKTKSYKTPKEALVKKWIATVEKDWQEHNPGADATTIQLCEEALLFADAVLPHYFSYWGKELVGKKWLSVEEQFSIPIPTPVGPIQINGKMDGVFELKKSPWLLETKTKSRLDAGTLADTLPMDLQTRLYLVVMAVKYSRVPGGLVYNIIKRPALRLKKGESRAAFRQRIFEDVASRPDEYFYRFEMLVTKSDIEQYKQQLGALLSDYVAWGEGKGLHYRNTNHCENKYGHCQFLPLCARGEIGLYYKGRSDTRVVVG